MTYLDSSPNPLKRKKLGPTPVDPKNENVMKNQPMGGERMRGLIRRKLVIICPFG